MASPFIVMHALQTSMYIYMHTLNPRIFALGSRPYFMQFLLCSFAFLCKVTQRGSITIVNRLRKLSIMYLVGHYESDTPLLWVDCRFGEESPHFKVKFNLEWKTLFVFGHLCKASFWKLCLSNQKYDFVIACSVYGFAHVIDNQTSGYESNKIYYVGKYFF